jgi:hypothetical protein
MQIFIPSFVGSPYYDTLHYVILHSTFLVRKDVFYLRNTEY